MIGDFLYQLTPRDSASEFLQVFTYRIQSLVLAANVDADFVIPDEHMLLLQGYTVSLVPGGAQSVRGGLLLFVEKQGGTNFRTIGTLKNVSGTNGAAGILSVINTGAGLAAAFDGNPQIYLPPGGTIKARGSFDAGAAANSVVLDLFGILMPKGNTSV